MGFDKYLPTYAAETTTNYSYLCFYLSKELYIYLGLGFRLGGLVGIASVIYRIIVGAIL